MISVAEADHVIQQFAILLQQAQVARSKLRQSTDAQVRLVTLKRFCELTGYTPDAVNKKVNTGVWMMGKIVVKAPDGRRLIDLQEYEKWAQGESLWA